MKQFQDVFLKRFLELPPHKEVDFFIELMPRDTPTSKETYWITTLELIEVKLQLMDMLDKGYIRLSLSPWGESMLFVNKNDDMLKMCIDYKQLDRVTIKKSIFFQWSIT